MTTTYLIALSNSLTAPPKTQCTRCTNEAVEQFNNQWLCFVHLIIYERMEEAVNF